MGLSPSFVGSDADSKWLVSERNGVGGHTAGEAVLDKAPCIWSQKHWEEKQRTSRRSLQQGEEKREGAGEIQAGSTSWASRVFMSNEQPFGSNTS